MTAGDMANGEGHRKHSKSKGQGDAGKGNPKLGITSSQHRAAASAKDEPEGAENSAPNFFESGIAQLLNLWGSTKLFLETAAVYLVSLQTATQKGAHATCVPKLRKCCITGLSGLHAFPPRSRIMSERRPQTLANHARLDPFFHFLLVPVLLICFIWSIVLPLSSRQCLTPLARRLFAYGIALVR